MTNKDLMQSLSYIRELLYRCPFSGKQMMVVSECVRVLDASLMRINGDGPNEETATKINELQQE